MTRDLTRGNPSRVIVQFAIPILLGLVLQQVYNLVDTMIVGKFVGLDALGGVGSTGALNFMVLGSCIGLCMGFGIPAANAFGAGEYAQLRRYVANSIYLCAISAAVVMAVVLVFCRGILTAMHTTPETFSYAYDYIYRIFWGIPFYVNALAAGSKINQMLCCPTDALGTAMATYCGQNLGAHRLKRIRKGLRVSVVISVIYSVFYVLVAWFGTGSISMLFLQQPDETLIGLIRQYLLWLGIFGWSLGLVNGFRFSIQGMGYSQLAILSGVMEMVARVAVALLLVPLLGYPGACLGSPIAWLMADCFLVPTAYWCLRTLRRKIPEDAPEQIASPI